MSESQEKKKNEWCNTCLFKDFCGDVDYFVKSNHEECEYYI